MKSNKYKQITNMFFEDLAVLFIIIPACFFICYLLITQGNWLKWSWVLIIILLIWYVAVSRIKRFKLYLLSQKDLKESRIIKKEIVVEELKLDTNYQTVHHASVDIVEDLITDVLFGWAEKVIKTRGGENRYIITDSENNAYHLMNFYKTKMRKKDLKKRLDYPSLKGRTIGIEYLEKSKIILSMTMDTATKNSKLIGGFWEIFGGYMI